MSLTLSTYELRNEGEQSPHQLVPLHALSLDRDLGSLWRRTDGSAGPISDEKARRYWHTGKRDLRRTGAQFFDDEDLAWFVAVFVALLFRRDSGQDAKGSVGFGVR